MYRVCKDNTLYCRLFIHNLNFRSPWRTRSSVFISSFLAFPARFSVATNRHYVFYEVESWSGVLEWRIGVEWSQILEWQKRLVLSEPTAKQHWGFDLVTLFGCFHMSCYILMNRAKTICHSKIWLNSTPTLHSKNGSTGLINSYNYKFGKPNLSIIRSLLWHLFCCILWWKVQEYFPHQNLTPLHSKIRSKTPLHRIHSAKRITYHMNIRQWKRLVNSLCIYNKNQTFVLLFFSK